MGVRYCKTCRMPDSQGHEPWCSKVDPGERPPEALIWERMDELEGKINRLAKHVGLPDDWDDE